MKISWIAGLFLFIAVSFLSGLNDSFLMAFLSLSLLLLLCVTALPLARLLFADPVDARIMAFPIGFVIHAVLLSFAGLIFGIHQWTIAAYLFLAVLLWAYSQFRAGRLQSRQQKIETQWTKSDVLLLVLWLLIALAIVAVPFARVGAETAQGQAYRAYFNADFFRNMAVAGSLSNTGIPPDNPYLGGRPLHYYWFFHLMDAYWRELLPSYRSDSLMVQFSLVAMLMFVGAFFVTLRRWIKHRKTSLLLLPIFAFGGSYEGLYVLQWLQSRQMPWTQFVNLNIDGILRWNWRAPQIDTLYRALLYAPQHLIALAIFLIALYVWNSQRLKETPLRCNTRLFIFYFLIFSTLGFSAFVGATLIIGAALILLIQTFREPSKKWKEALLSGLLGLVFLLVYLFPFQMFQFGSQQYDFGPDRIILAHFPAFFVLNWGALLIFGMAGIFLRSSSFPNRILIPFVAGCFLMILFVRIMLAGNSDISLKVGHFSHVVLLLLAAGFLDSFMTRFPNRARWLVLCVTLAVAPAFITWAMDAWNSSDIKSRRFTTYLNQADAEVTRWMQNNLPERTIVLNYSSRYDDFMQDIIPAFAERSVFVGNRIFSRIFQVPERDVRDRTATVSSLFQFTSPAETWRLAGESGIEYVFVSGIEAQEMPRLIEKFAPPYFSMLMQEGGSALFRVNADVNEERER